MCVWLICVSQHVPPLVLSRCQEPTRWCRVDIRFVRRLKRFVPLDELRTHPALSGMVLLNKSRLSIQVHAIVTVVYMLR